MNMVNWVIDTLNQLFIQNFTLELNPVFCGKSLALAFALYEIVCMKML